MSNNSLKRINKITIKRMIDDSPDTSLLGEYATKPTSPYSIDRAHSEYCQVNQNPEIIDKLDRAISYLQSQKVDGIQITEWESLDEAQDLMIDAQDKLKECDCDGRGDMERGQYRYFNPSFNYVDKFGAALPDNTPEDVRKYARQDYERMESLNRGSWSFIGIRAEAEITLQGVRQEITSGGLWGIESDSEQSYIKEVSDEELSSLREQLHAVGFSTRAISAACKSIESEDE